MPVSYNYNAEAKLVETMVEGSLSAQDMLEYVSTLVADDSIGPGFIEVVNLERVDDLTLQYKDLAPFKHYWREYMNKGSVGTIIYAPTDNGYGIFRMMQTVVGLSDEATAERFIVVRSRADIQEHLRKLRDQQTG